MNGSACLFKSSIRYWMIASTSTSTSTSYSFETTEDERKSSEQKFWSGSWDQNKYILWSNGESCRGNLRCNQETRAANLSLDVNSHSYWADYLVEFSEILSKFFNHHLKVSLSSSSTPLLLQNIRLPHDESRKNLISLSQILSTDGRKPRIQ